MVCNGVSTCCLVQHATLDVPHNIETQKYIQQDNLGALVPLLEVIDALVNFS